MSEVKGSRSIEAERASGEKGTLVEVSASTVVAGIPPLAGDLGTRRPAPMALSGWMGELLEELDGDATPRA
jgi:hypothetical protein